jgi:hypothetical protein
MDMNLLQDQHQRFTSSRTHDQQHGLRNEHLTSAADRKKNARLCRGISVAT